MNRGLIYTHDPRHRAGGRKDHLVGSSSEFTQTRAVCTVCPATSPTWLFKLIRTKYSNQFISSYESHVGFSGHRQAVASALVWI